MGNWVGVLLSWVDEGKLIMGDGEGSLSGEWDDLIRGGMRSLSGEDG